MRPRCDGGGLPVTRADGVCDCPVLVEIRVLEIDPKDFEPKRQAKLLVNLIRRPHEGLVSGRFDDHAMDVQSKIEIARGVGRRLVGRFLEFHHLGDDVAKPIEVFLSRDLTGELRRANIERFTNNQQIAELGDVKIGHRVAKIALSDDKPFLFKLHQRLTQRRAADAEALGERDFRKALRGAKLAAEDQVLQLRVRALAQ